MNVHFFTSNILEYANNFCVNQGYKTYGMNLSINNLYPYIYNIYYSEMLGFKSLIHL